MLKRKKEYWVHYSTHCERRCLFHAMPRKCGVGQELALVPIPLNIISLFLSVLLANCRSQLVSGLGREKLKVVLFYLTWVSNIFDSFDAHSFVHCSSIRSMHIHSLLDFFFLKYPCNIVEGLKGSKCLARPGPTKL